jgi:transposase
VSRSYKQYPKEFKLESVRLVLEQGLSQAQAASNLGIDQSLLGRWVRQFRSKGQESFPGNGKLLPADEKIRNLERDLRRVTQERDILKKAIAYFAEVPK